MQIHSFKSVYFKNCLLCKTGIVSNFGKIEALHHKKLKRTIQGIYVHVALYGCMIINIFDVETIILTLLMSSFSHFNMYIYFSSDKITIRKYKNIIYAHI